MKSPDAKEAFEIDEALERVRRAIEPYPKAAMFELYQQGYTSLYAQLVGCMLSIRTYDEVCLPVALRLLKVAPDAAALDKLRPEQIAALIEPVTFAGQKAAWLKALAQKALAEHGGELPADEPQLLGFKGVGPKCAHLALGIACEQPFISVDIHVHRITNR